MSITPGGQIGPYQINQEIGRGGMGVVYLGHDTRLDRPVAIKALPEHLAQDPDRLARFEREARTLATLTHPNVAGIYGVEEHEGAKYLILEYVEGDSLAEVLDRGPMPVDDALDIAVQIALGVEAAHDASVIHRDLKPDNIKITPEGTVKVLDFGLAKSTETQTASSTNLPTITSPAILNSPTIPGAIMGTAPYMSPEQARGRTVDKRTDIWSFGVILYEMLTGIGPFRGETVSDSIGAILHKDVDLELIPAPTPSMVRHVLKRCLVRDKAHRLQAIGDARIDLEYARTEPDVVGSAKTAASPVRWALLAIAVVLAGALGFAIDWAMAPVAESEGVLHVTVPIGVNPQLEAIGAFALSPATRSVAYISSYPEGESDDVPTAVYIRDLDSREPRLLAGTEHARSLSYSPDGSQITFSWFDPDSDVQEVRRISVNGGPVLTVFSDRSGREYDINNPPLWISDDEILVFSEDTTTVYKVPVAGGKPVELATLPGEGGWIFNWGPARLDDHSVFLNRGRLTTTAFTPTLFRLDLVTGDLTEILENAFYAHLLPNGTLLFKRENTLCMTTFDPVSAKITGSITPLLSGMLNQSSYSVSPRGDLCTISGVQTEEFSRVMSIDRSGHSEPLIDAKRDFNGTVSVSNDGEQIALSIVDLDGPPHSHTIDVSTGFIRPVYPQASVSISEGWTPDGRLAFVQWMKPAHAEVMLIDPAIESSVTTPYAEPDQAGTQNAVAFTPDGRYMLFEYGTEDEREGGIYGVDLRASDDERAPFPVVATSADEGIPAISPDGDWLAYVSDASGKAQVMLRPLDLDHPEQRARVYPVSFEGGTGPFWSRDGSELFFIASDPKQLMGVTITMDPALHISTPTIIIQAAMLNLKESFGNRSIDIMPDGEHFVYIEGAARSELPTHLDLTLNWLEELEQTAPRR